MDHNTRLMVICYACQVALVSLITCFIYHYLPELVLLLLFLAGGVICMAFIGGEMEPEDWMIVISMGVLAGGMSYPIYEKLERRYRRFNKDGP